MIDVVRAEAGAHQLLKQVRLLVRPLGGAEAGQCLAAVPVANGFQAACCPVERFFPGRFAEVRPGIRGIHLVVGALPDVIEAREVA